MLSKQTHKAGVFTPYYLRKLLVEGETSMIRRARTGSMAAGDWFRSLLKRRPARVVTVPMANKTARIAWAVPKRGEVYHPPAMACPRSPRLEGLRSEL